MSNEEHEAFGFKTNINLYKGKMIGDMLYPLSVLITFFLDKYKNVNSRPFRIQSSDK